MIRRLVDCRAPCGVADITTAFGELRGGRKGIRDRAQYQTVALVRSDAIDERDIRIEHYELAPFVDKGCIPKLHRMIHRLAEKNDQVSFLEFLGIGAQTRIVQSTWAFHPDDGNTEFRFQRPLRRPPRLCTHMRSNDNDRPFGHFQRCDGRVRRHVGQQLFNRHEIIRLRPECGMIFKLLFQNIRRQAEMNRTWPAGRSDAAGQRNIVTDFGHRLRHPGGFCHRRRHLRLRKFLKAAAPQLNRRCMARDQDHRHLRGLRRT